MVQLKGCQQEEVESKLQVTMCTTYVNPLKWLHMQTHVRLFESSQCPGSDVGDLHKLSTQKLHHHYQTALLNFTWNLLVPPSKAE